MLRNLRARIALRYARFVVENPDFSLVCAVCVFLVLVVVFAKWFAVGI
jgi:hypothetical protein